MAGQNVLVVDDEKRLTEFFERYFAKLGYQMQVALSGEEALKAVEQRQPALMLLDMRMPGVGGVQVLKTVKERYPNVKVVVLTSYDEEYKKAADQYHADAFFAKPPGLAQLTRKIEALLQPDDPPEQAAILEAPPDLIPKARLLFVTFGHVLTIMNLLECLHIVGEGTSHDEKKDSPDAGLYEWEEASTRKEVLEKLRERGFDFVFVPAGWWENEGGFLETRRLIAGDLVAEIMRSKFAPKEVFLFSGVQWDAAEAQAQEDKAVELGGSLIDEPSLWREDFEIQAAKINRILWERCKEFGLMAKRPIQPESGGKP